MLTPHNRRPAVCGERSLFFAPDTPAETPDPIPAAMPAAVPPVVDHRNKQAEDEKDNHPDADLLVNHSAIQASPAFAVIQQGACQAEYRRGGADGPGNRSQIGNKKTDDALPGCR